MSSAVSGSERGGVGQEVSPATPNGSRLVATSRRRGQARNRASARPAQASTRCSQLSSTNNIAFGPRYSISNSSTRRPGASRTPRAEATLWGTRSGSASAASSTQRVPSSSPTANSAANRRASLVLPEPPGPVIVSSRVPPRSSFISANSRSRPTKLVSSSGRSLGRGLASCVRGEPAVGSAFPPAATRRVSSARGRLPAMTVSVVPAAS